MQISKRFRGFLPVVVDVETSGFNCQNNALLELAAIIIAMDNNAKIYPKQTLHFHIKPFKNAEISKSAMEFNNIIIGHPFRYEVSEKIALNELYSTINQELKQANCTKAILVGHNANFDLGFIKKASKRCSLQSEFHQFSTLDTVSLSALAYGETVLAKAIKKADISWNNNDAHSALYDAEKTAELFCKIINDYKLH